MSDRANHNGTVLIVAGDKDPWDRVGRWLRDDGLVVRRCRDATTAVDAVRRTRPAAVALDLSTRPALAAGTLEELRTRHPRVPVVVMVSRSHRGDMADIIRLGAYDYFETPVQALRVLTAFRNAVERSRLEAGTGRSARHRDSRGRSMAEIERDAIADAVARHGGNLARVVRELGIGRTTLYRKLKKYGLR